MCNKVLNILKTKMKIIIILFMMSALFFGYFVGRAGNSKDRVITNLEVALKKSDARALSKILIFNDKKVNKEKLEPLVNYYSKNSNAIDNDIKKLRNGEDTSVFLIRNKKSLLGSSYNIHLKSYNVYVDSNYNEGEFTIDNKNFINGGEMMENIIPGVYTINGILKSKYGEIEASKEFVLVDNGDVKVDFDAVNVTIQSQFKDASVYINDEYAGITVDEAEDIGPFKNDGSISVYIEKEFPWGTVKGDKSYILDVPVLNLNINMVNDKIKKDLNIAAHDFYRSVFKALNEEEKSYIIGADNAVRDKIYSIFEKKYIFLKNKYSIDDIKIMDDKSEYTYENDMYRANVVVEVKYNTKKNFWGFDKEENSKLFFTKFIYDDEKSEWIVNDIENFSL